MIWVFVYNMNTFVLSDIRSGILSNETIHARDVILDVNQYLYLQKNMARFADTSLNVPFIYNMIC